MPGSHVARFDAQTFTVAHRLRPATDTLAEVLEDNIVRA